MKTLLIVEDEKAIRMGIRSMVERAPIDIEMILDCKNGAEAWEVLQSRPVDVLFTDIRMPKMDGIELITKSQTLASPPISIVISGYDDFSYAVGVFRQGVRDYLLKPIERERVFEILKNLEMELATKRKQQENSFELRCHLYRSLIFGGNHAPANASTHANVLSTQLDALLFRPYVVACVPPALRVSAPPHETLYILDDMDGHQALIAEADSLRKNLPHDCCAGISAESCDPARLRDAYHEAVAAREYAYVHGHTTAHADLPTPTSSFSMEDRLEQVIQLLGVSHVDDAQKLLEQTLFLAQNDKIPASAFIKELRTLPERLIQLYGCFLEEKDRLLPFRHIWMWNNAFEYCQVFSACIADLFSSRAFESQNDLVAKIHKAVFYVKNNFRADINMASVSNEVSMNYTQFSCLFKEYTGCNFSLFLRNIRLEESKKLLIATDLLICQIASTVGFQNEKHFMKAFKQSCGVSPSAYRKNHRPES